MIKEKLIEEIRKYPILYNLELSDYKNPEKKDKVWKQIGKQMNASPEKCKMAWKNLRDTYRRYKQRKSDGGAAFQRPWKFAHNMEFLENGKSFRKCILDDSELDTMKLEETYPPSPLSPATEIHYAERCKSDEENECDLMGEASSFTQPQSLSINDIINVLKATKDLWSSDENAKRKSTTSQMFESLETSINELNLSPEDRQDIEDKIWNFVRSEIKYYRN